MRFKTILAHIESRLDQLPILRQKLRRVPLDLDYPYWVDDEHFDLEYHVRHIALPKPGDWRQFCIQASRIHARPLDLNRPLWEIYVIEGLDGFLDLPVGSFALLTKMHHAAIDVENGSEITMLLHDLDATPPADPPPAPWFAERPPGAACAWCARGVGAHRGRRDPPGRAAGRAVRRAAPAALTLAGDLLLRPAQAAGDTLQLGGLAASRVRDPPLHARRVQDHPRRWWRGATVNDAVLAVCGGALRRYLDLHGELPEASLTAMAPFYVRPRRRRRGVAARADLAARARWAPTSPTRCSGWPRSTSQTASSDTCRAPSARAS